MSSNIAIQNDSMLVIDNSLENLLKQAVVSTLCAESLDAPFEVSILFCSNDEIHRLNKEYRGKDRPTDVLSFPIYDCREDLDDDVSLNQLADFFALGDVVIAPDVVSEAAVEIGDPFEKHLARMCIHSVLHLIGYDHETSAEDERVMLEKQEEILENFWKD